MAKPTKEEAAQWARTLDGVASDQLDFSRLDAHSLAGFLRRVADALPSAQAVQRDRERRKTAASKTRCPACGATYQGDTPCDCGA